MSTPAYHLVVIELDESMPRKNPRRPHLLVKSVMKSPEAYLDFLESGNGPEWCRGAIVRLRNDLVPYTRPTRSKAVADRREDETKLRLMKRGYAVNGDARVYRVYVIDLVPKPGVDIGKGNIYVGYSEKTPEERFKQHKQCVNGKKGLIAARPPSQRGLRLNWVLMGNHYSYTREGGERKEAEMVNRLY